MIDAGVFHPAAERPKLSVAGLIMAPRLTTTDEQMRETKWHLGRAAMAAGATSARAKVHWTRGAPTIVEVHGHLEHLTLPTGVEPVWATDRLIEFTVEGQMIPRDERARLERVKVELAEMREHAAGPTDL